MFGIHKVCEILLTDFTDGALISWFTITDKWSFTIHTCTIILTWGTSTLINIYQTTNKKLYTENWKISSIVLSNSHSLWDVYDPITVKLCNYSCYSIDIKILPKFQHFLFILKLYDWKNLELLDNLRMSLIFLITYQ